MNRLPPPFLVFALPRSRTAWLAKFLSYGDWTCEHDPSALWHSKEDLRELLQRPWTGAVDSALVFLWKEARAIRPDVKFLVVRRKRELVVEALKRLDLTVQPELLDAAERKLDEVSALADTLSVSFDDLCSPFTCGLIMNHCLSQPFNPVWFKALNDVNIQVNIRETLAKMALNRDGIARVYEGVQP